MSKDKKDKEDISRASQAKEFVENPLFQEAITKIKAHYLLSMEGTKADQSKERDEIWRRFKTLDAIVADFERTIRRGKMAEENILKRARDKIFNNS